MPGAHDASAACACSSAGGSQGAAAPSPPRPMPARTSLSRACCSGGVGSHQRLRGQHDAQRGERARRARPQGPQRSREVRQTPPRTPARHAAAAKVAGSHEATEGGSVRAKQRSCRRAALVPPHVISLQAPRQRSGRRTAQLQLAVLQHAQRAGVTSPCRCASWCRTRCAASLRTRPPRGVQVLWSASIRACVHTRATACIRYALATAFARQRRRRSSFQGRGEQPTQADSLACTSMRAAHRTQQGTSSADDFLATQAHRIVRFLADEAQSRARLL